MMLRHEEFEEARTKKAVGMLMVDRKNEFRELAEVLLWRVPSKNSVKDWESFVLNFCLDVSKAFEVWSGKSEGVPNSDMHALTILRQLSRGKTSMIQMTNLLNTAFDLATEFKIIYERIR